MSKQMSVTKKQSLWSQQVQNKNLSDDTFHVQTEPTACVDKMDKRSFIFIRASETTYFLHVL